MSNERPIKKPGRSGAAFRSGPMVENPVQDALED